MKDSQNVRNEVNHLLCEQVGWVPGSFLALHSGARYLRDQRVGRYLGKDN